MTVRWFEQSQADVPVPYDWLGPWESSHLSGLGVPKRRADWRLGRWTAKYAVAHYLGLSHDAATLATIEIRPAASGAPEVFRDDVPANLSISLSHSGGVGACAVGPWGAIFGCDLELVEARTDAFIDDYFTPEEQRLIREDLAVDHSALTTLIWSAKESALKALRTGLRSDTRCVSVTLRDNLRGIRISDEPNAIGNLSLGITAPIGTWRSLDVSYNATEIFHGWWLCRDQLIRTLVCIPSIARAADTSRIGRDWASSSGIDVYPGL
jgi:4'-phosphopantetheinyl transferase